MRRHQVNRTLPRHSPGLSGRDCAGSEAESSPVRRNPADSQRGGCPGIRGDSRDQLSWRILVQDVIQSLPGNILHASHTRGKDGAPCESLSFVSEAHNSPWIHLVPSNPKIIPSLTFIWDPPQIYPGPTLGPQLTLLGPTSDPFHTHSRHILDPPQTHAGSTLAPPWPHLASILNPL